MHVYVSGAKYFLWKTNKFVFVEVWPKEFFYEETQKTVWHIVGEEMSYFMAGFVHQKIGLRTSMERHWWKLLRLSAKQSMLPRFGKSFWGPKTDKIVFWLWCQLVIGQEDESWLQKWITISFFGKIFPPIVISCTRSWAEKSKIIPIMA